MSGDTLFGVDYDAIIDEPPEELFYFEAFGDEDAAEEERIATMHEADECPFPEEWEDVEVSKDNTKFTIDQSKNTQWKMAKDEITHVRDRFSVLSGIDFQNVKFDDIVKYYFGSESEFGKLMQRELGIEDVTYLEFMHTVCIHAGYNQTPSQLYDEKGLLSRYLLMAKEEYVGLWEKLSLHGKMQRNNFIGEGRLEKYMWEKMEDLANEIFRETVIATRRGAITISLDDDKVWCDISHSTQFDTFGLKYTHHTRPNRKGFTDHNAISSGAQIPLNLQFERKRDSAVSCFKRIMGFLFGRTGGGIEKPDLRNVIVASDRGYMVPTLVFQYLIPCGGSFVGTTKRLLQGWPFTFNQEIKETDGRELVPMKGAATLYVKKIKRHDKTIFSTAFRNGSGKVNTTISSIHRNHHWEGVAYYPSEARLYESKDRNTRLAMVNRGLARVDEINPGANAADQGKINFIRDRVVKVLTIRQGK